MLYSMASIIMFNISDYYALYILIFNFLILEITNYFNKVRNKQNMIFLENLEKIKKLPFALYLSNNI